MNTVGDTPVFIPCGEVDLFGMLTRPQGRANGVTVLALWGGVHPVFGRNQMRSRLARELAASGFHVLRIDFHGIGDSSGDHAFHRLDQPNVSDVKAAVRWLEEQGLSRVVLVGTCFGARTSLASASEVSGLAGVALLACPLREEGHAEVKASRLSLSTVLRRGASMSSVRLLMDPRGRSRIALLLKKWLRRAAAEKLRLVRQQEPEWASPRFLRPFAQLVHRRVPVLLAYGKGDDFYPDFERARLGRLGRLIGEGGELVTVRVIEERLHGFTSLAVQLQALDMVSTWLTEVSSLVPTKVEAG